MGSKTISLKDEAYKRLKALKTGEKSFSDVVLEITEKENQGLEALIGAESGITVEQLIEDRKRDFDRDRKEIFS